MSEKRRFHLVPVGGTAMVPLAALLLEEGHGVTGSDRALYPPMSTLVETLGIRVAQGFAPEHVPADCDTVIVGNAALRDNVEAAEAVRRGLPVLSLPQAVRQHLLPGKSSVVITGTHGKTTTSALTSWLLLDSGRDPGFLVGGEMKNLGRGYRRGNGPHFVLEGDEYNAAFFDRGPKFLHYEPQHLFVGNIEYDHADLYPDLSSVIEAFRRVVRLVPPGGVVVLNADDPRVAALSADASAAVVRVSLEEPGADFSAREVAFHPEGAEFTLLEAGLPTARLASPLLGLHNVRNALGAIALVRGLGLSTGEIARALARFAGVRRRMDLKGEKNGILVVDDFAHHPTAVAGTIQAARSRFPGRRLWALFEPRSNTAGRKMFEEEYAEAFAGADALVVAPVFHAQRLGPDNQIDRDALVRRFASAGARPAFAPGAIDEIPAILRREARPGDVVLLMSSGAFGGLPETLLAEL
ncbi:MAG TPA: Mur ligase family protein [Thermoanaerobaculia bacterium]|jgi:UDP-N-acetylmuramate: L-alanyl-gamma-D-glutamyl-meso-diaminopimelate ligase|nr:Mur ligase family protein [Thermoanaerobaculia bacterium]